LLTPGKPLYYTGRAAAYQIYAKLVPSPTRDSRALPYLFRSWPHWTSCSSAALTNPNKPAKGFHQFRLPGGRDAVKEPDKTLDHTGPATLSASFFRFLDLDVLDRKFNILF